METDHETPAGHRCPEPRRRDAVGLLLRPGLQLRAWFRLQRRCLLWRWWQCLLRDAGLLRRLLRWLLRLLLCARRERGRQQRVVRRPALPGWRLPLPRLWRLPRLSRPRRPLAGP